MASQTDSTSSSWKLIHYLNWVTEILQQPSASWNIDALCEQMARVDIDPQEVFEEMVSGAETDVFESDVRKILLSDKKLVANLKTIVENLLELVYELLLAYPCDTKELVDMIGEICRFLEKCENNHMKGFKGVVTKFLTKMFSVIDKLDPVEFLEKGYIYQLAASIIENFKVVHFARSFILSELLKKLENLCATSSPDIEAHQYEMLLLYLTVLKDILHYGNDTQREIDNAILQKLEGCLTCLKVPLLVETLVKECINLLQ